MSSGLETFLGVFFIILAIAARIVAEMVRHKDRAHRLYTPAAGGVDSDVLRQLQSMDEDRLFEVATNHERDEVRIAAIELVNDQKTLATLFTWQTSSLVQRAAFNRITDQKIIAKVARSDTDSELRRTAQERLTDLDLLGAIALSETLVPLQVRIMRRIVELSEDPGRDPRLLSLARQSQDAFVSALALEQVEAPDLLRRVALDPGADVQRRAAASQGVQEQPLLARLARDPVAEVRRGVVSRLEDQALLVELAQLDPSEEVALEAVEALDGELGDTHRGTLARSSRWPSVRAIAVVGIKDQATLAELVKISAPVKLGRPLPDWVSDALGRLEDRGRLAGLANGEEMGAEQRFQAGLRMLQLSRPKAALQLINGRAAFLRQVFHRSEDWRLKVKLIPEVRSQELIQQLASDRTWEVRQAACRVMEDQGQLAALVERDPVDEVRLTAAQALSDHGVISGLLERNLPEVVKGVLRDRKLAIEARHSHQLGSLSVVEVAGEGGLSVTTEAGGLAIAEKTARSAEVERLVRSDSASAGIAADDPRRQSEADQEG